MFLNSKSHITISLTELNFLVFYVRVVEINKMKYLKYPIVLCKVRGGFQTVEHWRVPFHLYGGSFFYLNKS